MLVSRLTEQQQVDESLLVEIFQSSIYPVWLRNLFKVKSSITVVEEIKLDSRQCEEIRNTEKYSIETHLCTLRIEN